MALIQTLPTEVIHLIAAGEVIESLVAAVKELIENAVDAHSTRIAISIWTDTLSIQVSDNGCGMSCDDLERAATPHTTSKIQTEQDLHQIRSLGFRGEALHSLSQLADLQISSRLNQIDGLVQTVPEQQVGWQVNYDRTGNIQTAPRSIAIAPGTIVTARHLFAHRLARLEKLPAIAQQLRKIQLAIQEMAIAHPQIAWQVNLDDRSWFTIFAGQGIQDILPQVLNSIKLGDLVSNSDRNLRDASIQLTLGLPDRLSRYRPDWVKVAVNGRFIHFPEMEQTILSALSRTLRSRRYPVCVIHLHVPPTQVDWNRHPAKYEVYLNDLDLWRDRVSELIIQTLQTAELGGSANTDRLLRTAETKQQYSVQGNTQTSPSLAKALAQVHNTYILAEHAAGLWLVEQHVAHERILFEDIEEQWQIIAIEEPIILRDLSLQRVEHLQAIAIAIESFGENVWAVRSLPAILLGRDDISEILLELSLNEDLPTAKATAACRSAIRNGTPLDLNTMQDILDRWQKTRHPHTCPHGRPICLSLEESQLARFFRRNWIVDKGERGESQPL